MYAIVHTGMLIQGPEQTRILMVLIATLEVSEIKAINNALVMYLFIIHSLTVKKPLYFTYFVNYWQNISKLLKAK